MSSGTRVALFCSSLSGGGAERMMLNIASGLADRGFDVEMVLTRRSGEYLNLVPDAVSVTSLEAERELRSLPGLIRYLRDRRPAYLLSTGTGINVIAVLATRLAHSGTKVVTRLQNTYSQDFQQQHRLVHSLLPLLVKQTLPLADVVVANSTGVATDIVGLTRLSASDVRVIYNPTVTDELFELAAEPVDIPFDDGELLVTAGRLSPEKDPETLLRAFARVATERDVRLLVLGKGDLRPDLESLATDLGIQDRVHFAGFVDNPYAYLRRADLFVLSSKWEGLPNALIEALACGTQVVSTDCPSGPSEILEDGTFGTLVPVGDPDALAEGIERELETRRDPTELEARGRDFAAERIVDEYAALFR